MSSDAPMEVDPTDDEIPGGGGGPAPNDATAAGVYVLVSSDGATAAAAPSRSTAAEADGGDGDGDGDGGGLRDAAAAAAASIPSSTNTNTTATAAHTGTGKEAAAPPSAAPTGALRASGAPQPQPQAQALRRLSSDLRHTASDAALRAVQAVLGHGSTSSGGSGGNSGDSGDNGDDMGSSGSGPTNRQTGAEAGAAAAAGAAPAPAPAGRSNSNGGAALRPGSAPAPAPTPTQPPPSASASAAATTAQRRSAESALNRTLVDPDRYGWTAAGGIADLATPHQRARAAEPRAAYTARTVPTVQAAQTAHAEARAERRRAKQRKRDRERREGRRRAKELAERQRNLRQALVQRGMSAEEAAAKAAEPETQVRLMAAWEEQRRRERDQLQQQRQQQKYQEHLGERVEMARDRALAVQRAHPATGAVAAGAAGAAAPAHQAPPVSLGGGVNSSSVARIRALAATDRARVGAGSAVVDASPASAVADSSTAAAPAATVQDGDGASSSAAASRRSSGVISVASDASDKLKAMAARQQQEQQRKEQSGDVKAAANDGKPKIAEFSIGTRSDVPVVAGAASDGAMKPAENGGGPASHGFGSSAIVAAAPPPTSTVASEQHADAAANLVSLAAGPSPPAKETVPATTTAGKEDADASGSAPGSGDKEKKMGNPNNKSNAEGAPSGSKPTPLVQGESAESASTAKPKSRKKKVPPKDQFITPLALGEDGLVDIYAYHRGRAGLEPRSPRSGELLCDVAPSDTGQQFALNKEAEDGSDKKFIVTIDISFPLCDLEDILEEEEEEGGEENATAVVGNDTVQGKSVEEPAGMSKDLPLQRQNSRDANHAGTSRHLMSRENSAVSQQSRKSSSKGVSAEDDKGACPAIPRFYDQIEWDLSSPDTPTAMAYATSVASEFGLSFGQTLDLASSIQEQIDTFVRKSGIIRPLPYAAKDPLGVDRPASSSVVLMPTLHGGAHNGGGTVQVISQQQQQGGVARANLSRTSSRVSAASSGRSRQRGAVKPDAVEHSVVPEHMLKTFETEENKYRVAIEFRREVVKRAKEEYRQQLIAQHEGDVGDGMVGNLEFVKDDVCHICHKRKSAGVKFSCKNHVFCENHCCTRMGFSAKAIRDGNPMALDYCPVCCRTCLCSKCTKKLDDVSSHFQRLCDNQGCSDDPSACQAHNILELCVGQSSKLHKAQSELKKSSSSTKRRAPIDADDASQSSRGSRSARDTATVSIRKQEPPKPKKIGKPKPSEFPVEACGGFDLDPSLENDHRTVFLPDGASYVRNEAPMPSPNVEELELAGADASSGVVEDGSVDYCQHCQLGGDLICCDRCPRSFHAKCLPDGLDEDDIPDADWMCHLCVRDSSAQPNNDISGARTIGLITAAYTDVDHCEGFTEKLLTLSKIHELLAFLVEFDFGYMFKDPVNAKDVPDYTRIIKKPMDLGTIRGNLINLKYMKAAKRDLSKENIPESQMTARILDEIILFALKDLELIYHNCFTYNVRGTAVYRMAEVQRRKAKMIIEKSIMPCLDEDSASRLEEYSKQLQMSRDEKTAKGPKRVGPSIRHKIDVPFTHSKNGRIIAVFDPTKNMVVKQYSSVRGAVKAALYIAGLGYEPELNVTDNSVKNLIRKSSRDPSQQLFQYRWFYLDDLRSGRATIIPLPISEEDRAAIDEATSKKAGKDSSPVRSSPNEDTSKKAHKKAKAPAKKEDEEKAEYCIERRANQRVVYYKSIEAALDALNQEAILARAALVQPVKFQAILEGVPPGDEVVTMGSKWRLLETAPRLTSNGRRPNLPVHPDDKGKDKSDTDTVTCYPGLAAIFSLGDDMFFEPSMETVLPHCIIVKVCRLSNKILGGFESIQSAFEDWKQCRDGVLCGFAPSDPITIEAFHTLYVKGEKNIEGIEWKEVEPLETRFKRPRAESTGGDGDDKKKAPKRPRSEENETDDKTAAGNSEDEDALPSSGDMDVETLV